MYATLKPSLCPKRNVKSVERRVKKILYETISFAGCVAKVLQQQPSGTDSSDVIHLSTAIFNKLTITCVTDDCGQTFKLLSCWSELKDNPKFDLMLNPPIETVGTDNDSEIF